MLDEVKGWGWLVVLVANALFWWGGWSLSKKFVTREDYEADRTKLREAQSALAKGHEAVLASQSALETAINNLPTGKEMHAIALSLTEMRGDMKALSEKMDGQTALQARMENNLDLLMRGHMRTES